MDMSRADLGLLLSLDALLRARSVSVAARQLGLSQPALSAQLARLRDLFDDALLVPSGRSMVPTARAEALTAPLHAALEHLRALVREGQGFDPGRSTRVFRIAGSEFILHTLPLAARLRQAAPGIKLALLAFDARRAWSQLESDEVDLLLGSERLTPPAARARRLFGETLAFVQRRDHPRGTAPLTLDVFCALEHVLVSPEGGGFVGATDAALDRLGRGRRVVVSLPSFLLVPQLLRQTDLVALVPSRLARSWTESVDAFEPPLEVAGFSVFASWHQRHQSDPGHAWLREQIAMIATTTSGKTASISTPASGP
jgi:DNA-binding transcriptional LysR family regulator